MEFIVTSIKAVLVGYESENLNLLKTADTDTFQEFYSTGNKRNRRNSVIS